MQLSQPANRLLRRHCCMSQIPHEASPLAMVLILITALLFILMFLGIIKGILGLLWLPKVGIYGLNLLVELPRPLVQYQEKELLFRPVAYDVGGWPVHPDTLERTVRILPKRTEFCLNIIFFLAYPLAAIIYVFSLCCCIRNYRSNENMCFRKVNVIRLGQNECGECDMDDDEGCGGCPSRKNMCCVEERGARMPPKRRTTNVRIKVCSCHGESRVKIMKDKCKS